MFEVTIQPAVYSIMNVDLQRLSEGLERCGRLRLSGGVRNLQSFEHKQQWSVPERRLPVNQPTRALYSASWTRSSRRRFAERGRWSRASSSSDHVHQSGFANRGIVGKECSTKHLSGRGDEPVGRVPVLPVGKIPYRPGNLRRNLGNTNKRRCRRL